MVPLSPDDIRYIDELIVRINAMIAGQAAANDADFVDTYRDSGGHDVCKLPPNRWFEGLVPTEPAYPLHPNAKGEASMARSALAVLSQPRQQAGPGPGGGPVGGSAVCLARRSRVSGRGSAGSGSARSAPRSAASGSRPPSGAAPACAGARTAAASSPPSSRAGSGRRAWSSSPPRRPGTGSAASRRLEQGSAGTRVSEARAPHARPLPVLAARQALFGVSRGRVSFIAVAGRGALRRGPAQPGAAPRARLTGAARAPANGSGEGGDFRSGLSIRPLSKAPNPGRFEESGRCGGPTAPQCRRSPESERG